LQWVVPITAEDPSDIFSATTFIITATLETSDFLCLVSEDLGDLQLNFVSLVESPQCFKGTTFHCKFGNHSLKYVASCQKTFESWYKYILDSTICSWTCKSNRWLQRCVIFLLNNVNRVVFLCIFSYNCQYKSYFLF